MLTPLAALRYTLHTVHRNETDVNYTLSAAEWYVSRTIRLIVNSPATHLNVVHSATARFPRLKRFQKAIGFCRGCLNRNTAAEIIHDIV